MAAFTVLVGVFGFYWLRIVGVSVRSARFAGVLVVMSGALVLGVAPMAKATNTNPVDIGSMAESMCNYLVTQIQAVLPWIGYVFAIIVGIGVAVSMIRWVLAKF
jgi:hypothetical protein